MSFFYYSVGTRRPLHFFERITGGSKYVSLKMIFSFLIVFWTIEANSQPVPLGECNPNQCNETSDFTATQVGLNQFTFTTINTNGTNPLWTITAPDGTITTAMGFTTTTTFTQNGTYQIVFTKTQNGSQRRCCKTLVNVIGGACNFTSHFFIDCSRLNAHFEPNAFALTSGFTFTYIIAVNNGISGVINSGGFPNPSIQMHNVEINNFNPCDQPILSVTMEVRNQAGTLICTVTRAVLVVDQTNTPIRGRFVGRDCTRQTLQPLIDVGLIPATPYQGNPSDACSDLYVLGILDVEKPQYTLNNVRVRMGQSAAINVEGASGNPAILNLDNGTTVGTADQCDCLWRGINVYQYGQLNINENTAGGSRVTLKDAMFAVRGLRWDLSSKSTTGNGRPALRIRNADVNNNFIGLRLTDGAFTLGRLSATDFKGGNIKAQCWSCPTIINDLQDVSIVSGNVNPVWLNNAFLGNFAPVNSNNINSTTGQGSFFVPNNSPGEQDYPFDATPNDFTNHAYSGILVDGIRPSGFGISGATPFNVMLGADLQTQVPNNFLNLQAGILINGSTANITGSCNFDDITDEFFPNNSGEGVLFLSDNGNQSLTASQNIFSNSVRGIYAAPYNIGFGTVTAQGNLMTNLQHGICVINPRVAGHGFGFTGNFRAINVNTNTIDASNKTVSTVWPNKGTDTYGVFVADASATPTMTNINDNIISVSHKVAGNQGEGIFATGLNSTQDCYNGPFPSLQDCDHIDRNMVTIKQGFEGIKVLNSVNAVVRENTVRFDENLPVASSSNLSFDYLLRFDGGRNNVAICNHLFTDNNYTLAPNVGLYGLHASFHRDAEYYVNDVNGTNTGISFNGDCGTASVIEQNDMNGPMRFGLFYDGLAQGPFGPVKTRTGNQFDRGNRWTGTFTSNKAFADLNANIGDSQYRVHFGASNQNPLPSVSPLGAWFSNTGALVAKRNCLDYLLAVPPDRSVTSFDQNVVAPSQPGNPSLYFSKMYLYSRLLQNPSLNQGNANLQAFQSNNQASNLATFQTALDVLETVSQISSTQQASYDAAIANVNAADNLLQLATNALIAAPQNATLQANVDAARSGYETAENQAAAFLTQVQANLQSVASQQGSILSTVVPTEIAETQLKWVLEKRFSTLSGTGSSLLNTSEMSQLEALANSCPELDGPAVYFARTWLANITGQATSGSNCAGSSAVYRFDEQPIEFEQTQQQGLSIAPNPSDDASYIQSPRQGTIELHDLLGKIVLSNKINANDPIRMDLSQLANGLYLLLLRDSDLPAVKVLIQH